MSSRRDPSLLALVRGVLWPGFLGTRAPDWLKRELEGGLAGVVYFSQNLDAADPAQPARLSRELTGIRPPALIGVDEEGGNVTRLESTNGSSLPGHAQLGRVDDIDATRTVGQAIGRRVAAAGANVALAPVADVNTNAANPVIGVRSFGADTDLVGRHVAAMANGLRDAGVIACAKHFPGHGDTHTDSHHDLPRIDLSWERVLREHVPPFLAAVEAGIPAIMTAHIVVPELGELPATLNPRVLGELRDAGFSGSIVTDALDMAAIRSHVGAGVGGVRALLAGSDLLCVGNPSNLGPKGGATGDTDDYFEVRDAICDALDDGTLSLAVLERAARSVAELSDRAASMRADAADAPDAWSETDALVETDALRRIARQAITVRGDPTPLSRRVRILDIRDRATVAVASKEDYFTTAIDAEYAVTRVHIEPLDVAHTRLETDRALADAPPGDSILVLVNRIAADGPQRAALDAIAARRAEAIVVNAGLAADTVPGLTIIETLASSRLSAEILCELLRREVPV